MKFADYAVVLTALFPLAAWKVVKGGFQISENDLSSMVGEFLPFGPWMVCLTGGAFTQFLALWITKSVMEIRNGSLNWPKTIFIAVTVTAAFFCPCIGKFRHSFSGYERLAFLPISSSYLDVESPGPESWKITDP